MRCMRGGAGQARSQTQEIGLAGENSVAVMLRDVPCFLYDKFPGGLTLSRGWKKWEDGRQKFQDDTKDVRRY